LHAEHTSPHALLDNLGQLLAAASAFVGPRHVIVSTGVVDIVERLVRDVAGHFVGSKNRTLLGLELSES
jgi:hypothetical protein